MNLSVEEKTRRLGRRRKKEGACIRKLKHFRGQGGEILRYPTSYESVIASYQREYRIYGATTFIVSMQLVARERVFNLHRGLRSINYTRNSRRAFKYEENAKHQIVQLL